MEFLRTRVARRVLSLFVLGSLFPIAVLVALSYRAVSSQLESQSEQRLADVTDIASQSLLDRFDFFHSWLRGVGVLGTVGVGRAGDPGSASFTDVVPGGVEGLALEEDGRVRTITGTVGQLPPLGAEDGEQLATGRPLVKAAVGIDGASPSIFMALSTRPGDPDRGVLWARITGDSLWATTILWASTSTVQDLCILDAGSRPFHCNRGEGSRLPETVPPVGSRESNTGLLDVEMGTEDYKAGWREVYLPPTYGTPSWTVVVSESRSTVYSQVEWFAYYLPVAVVSGLSFVLLLASVVVRRTMDPLERLTEGTRRIAEQDFGTRVEVESKDEFGELAASFNTMAERLGLQFREIKAGTAIDRAVLSASGHEIAMRAVLDGVADVVPSAHRAVLLLEWGSSVEGSLYSVSPSDDGVVESTCSLDEADRAWLYGDNMHVLASNGMELPAVFDGAGFADDDQRVLVLRLVVQGEALGAVAIARQADRGFSEEEVRRAEHLADQAAVALNDLKLRGELEEMSWEALRALANAIDAKSAWTAGHSERVTDLALEVGRELELSDKEMDVLHRGGLLHDLGKIGVSLRVLDHPGKLDQEMRKEIEAHPVIGARILEPIRAFQPMLPIVLYHHERWDGQGYPEGLKGLEIPRLARLVAVADVYDAMVSARPYRGAMDPQSVLEEIRSCSGTQFDPEMVVALMRVMESGWLLRNVPKPVLIDA